MAFLLSSVILVLFPEIDIGISNLFYKKGLGFVAGGTFYENILYHSITYVTAGALLIPILLYIYNFFTKKNILKVNAKVILYLGLVLSIGPGLIVNELLKNHWGRPRPAETTLFGGTKEFTPPFIITDQDGYSFSSGHVAAAFFLLTLALLVRKNKAFWVFLASSYGIAISYVRIAAGGHFFSDAVVSFFITYIISIMFYNIFFTDKEHV